MEQHTGTSADRFDRIVANDDAFNKAIALVVAARSLWKGYHGHGTKIPMTMPQRVPEEIQTYVMNGVSEYENAVIAGRELPKSATFDDLTAYEASVKTARDTMRYRTNQLLQYLNLSAFMDWEGFTSIHGWKSGDPDENQS